MWVSRQNSRLLLALAACSAPCSAASQTLKEKSFSQGGFLAKKWKTSRNWIGIVSQARSQVFFYGEVRSKGETDQKSWWLGQLGCLILHHERFVKHGCFRSLAISQSFKLQKWFFFNKHYFILQFWRIKMSMSLLKIEKKNRQLKIHIIC